MNKIAADFKIDTSGGTPWNPETSFPTGSDWEDKFDLEKEPATEEPATEEPVPDLLPKIDELQKALEQAKSDGSIDPKEMLGLLGNMMGMVQLLVNSTPPEKEKTASVLRSRRGAKDGWEAVKGKPGRERKRQPGGGYSYRDRPTKQKNKGEASPNVKDDGGDNSGTCDDDCVQKKSDPKLVDRFRQELPEYKLTLVARKDGILDKADIENVKDIQGKLKWMADRVEKGIKESADICKMKPPVCDGNMGITRNHMPQIMDSTTKDLLASMEEQEYDDLAKQVEEAGGDVKAAIPDKGKREAFVNRRKGLAAVEAGADPEDDRPILKQLMHDVQASGTAITENVPVPVGKLKATQSEIKAGKTYGIANAFLNGSLPEKVMKNPIIATSDGHILDGHHRYSAALTIDPNYNMNVTVIDMPMRDFLMRAHQQPGVFRADIEDNIIPANEKVDLATPPESNPQEIKKITRSSKGDAGPKGESGPKGEPGNASGEKLWSKDEWDAYKKNNPDTKIKPKFASIAKNMAYELLTSRIASKIVSSYSRNDIPRR